MWRDDMRWGCFPVVFTPTKRWKGRVQRRKVWLCFVDFDSFGRNKNTFELFYPGRPMATMTVSTPDTQDVAMAFDRPQSMDPQLPEHRTFARSVYS